MDILAHLISLLQASKQQKDEGLASIETEVSDAEVQRLPHDMLSSCQSLRATISTGLRRIPLIYLAPCPVWV